MVHGATEQVAQVEQVGQTELVSNYQSSLWRALCCKALSSETQEQQQREIRTQRPRPRLMLCTARCPMLRFHLFPL